MPTREEFITAYEHEFGGIIMDALTGERRDGQLSLWLKTAMNKIRDRLGRAYDVLAKDDAILPIKPKTPANGQPSQARRAT